MVLTSRGRVLVATAVGAWLLSRILGVDELAMAALAIAALVALSLLYTLLASGRLQARRRLERHRLFFGDEGRVGIELRNNGAVPTSGVQVTEEVPDGLGGPASFTLASLARGEAVRVGYRVTGEQRGVHTLGPLHVRLPDPFGIAARRQELAITDPLTVYPPIWPLPSGLPFGGRRAREGEGRTRAHTRGEELGTVREYVRGDDLRRVHWRTTAHRGKLMVRQDEATQHPEAVVVLDRHGPADRGSFETAVAAAASAVYHLVGQDFELRLLTEPTPSTPPPVRLEEALQTLAEVAPQSQADAMAGVWRQLSRGAGGQGTLIAITGRPGRDQLRAMIEAGRSFGVRAALLVGPAGPPGEAGPAAALRGAGWRVATLAPGDGIDERWAELIAHQPHAARAARRRRGPAGAT